MGTGRRPQMKRTRSRKSTKTSFLRARKKMRQMIFRARPRSRLQLPLTTKTRTRRMSSPAETMRKTKLFASEVGLC
jgi:hypothetical protein